MLPVVEKLSDRPHLHGVVVSVDVGSDLDFLDLERALPLLGFARLPLVAVTVLAVVEDFADRRGRIGRHLHKVEPGVLGACKSLFERDDAHHGSIEVD